MSDAVIDRLTPGDIVMLATDVGPAPAQAGLLLDLGQPPADADDLLTTLRLRLSDIPALRERLVRLPPGLGRPIWVTDEGFDTRRHLYQVELTADGDRVLLDAAAGHLTRRLPLSRPPWAFTVFQQPDGHLAVMAVMHHVLADGVRGLALLAGLADPVDDTADPDARRDWSEEPVHRKPSRSALLHDVWLERVRHLGDLRGMARTVTALRADIGGAAIRKASTTSLNRPTGRERRLTVGSRDVEPVRVAAHRADATVNDILLIAVTTGLAAELVRRGERPDHLVVSVPMAVAGQARAQGLLGNATSVMPVDVPLQGTLNDRLRAVAAMTRDRKTRPAGGAVVLMGPVFRALAGLGLFHAMIDRQHLINTFVSNLRGPSAPITMAGLPVRRIIPMAATAGNVGASVFALSYNGSLTLTLVHDPTLLPDGSRVLAGVLEALDALTA